MKLRDYNHFWFFNIGKYKVIEVQTAYEKDFADWFGISIETRTRQDHPGVYFTFEFLRRIYFHVWIYDGRHWDFENDRLEENK